MAALVLGIVLIMSPTAQTAVLEEGWLLPAAACLLAVRQPGERKQR
ncbi:hypothetical protein [Streptomyces prasinus]